MVVLTVLFVPTGHFVLLCLLLLKSHLVNRRGLRILLLWIEFLTVLCHTIPQKKITKKYGLRPEPP